MCAVHWLPSLSCLFYCQFVIVLSSFYSFNCVCFCSFLIFLIFWWNSCVNKMILSHWQPWSVSFVGLDPGRPILWWCICMLKIRRWINEDNLKSIIVAAWMRSMKNVRKLPLSPPVYYSFLCCPRCSSSCLHKAHWGCGGMTTSWIESIKARSFFNFFCNVLLTTNACGK